MRALELTGFDGPSSLRMVEREPRDPGEGEVRVGLKAMALNHLDVFVSRGLPKRSLPAILGSDGAGVVEAVGAGVTECKRGDSVLLFPIVDTGPDAARWEGREMHSPTMAILGEQVDGTFQESLTLPARNCYAVPEHLSLDEAAALPMAWLTAWRLLFTRGRLSSGDAIVVVGAGGGVATACIQLASARGIRVFATSRSEQKRERARALGAELTFASEGFSKSVLEATDGEGVRAVVDTVGPATLEQSIRCLAREGMILTVGATSGPKVEISLPRFWFRHLSLVTSTMGSTVEFRQMLEDVERARLRPAIDRAFPLAEGPDAFRYLEAGEQFGKVLLRP